MSARQSILKKLSDGRYQARVWDDARQPSAGYTSKRFDKRADAVAWTKATEGAIARGVRTEHAYQRSTVGDVCDRWLMLNRPAWKRATYVRAEREVRLMVKPTLGGRAVAELRASDVELWRNGLLDTGYSAASVNLGHGSLSAALDVAVRDGLVIGNVARSTKRVSERRKTRAVARKAMPLDLIDGVRDAMPAPLRIGVTLAFGLGLRPAELFGLTLDRVDFERGEVTIDRQFSRYGKGSTYGLDDAKHDSARTVPVPPALLAAIRAHVERFGLARNGAILARPSLEPMTSQAWDVLWRRALAAAGGLKGAWTPHSLRHAFGSYQLAAGNRPAQVAAWMGNTLAVFLNVYAHDVDDGAAAADLDALPRDRAQSVHRAPRKRILKAV